MTSVSSTHFFKFIRPGLKIKSSIPRSFWRKLNERSCKIATLKRGRHEWSVHISDEGVFCDGWEEFVRDNGIQEFDFIVFKHQGHIVFDFMVFDESMCERQYPPKLFDEMDVEKPLIESDSTNTYERSKVVKKQKRNRTSSKNEDRLPLDDDRCFTATMRPSYIKTYILHVPTSFARSNGLLTGTRRTRVVLTDEAQMTCQATLDNRRSSQLRLVCLRPFIIKNDLKVGDECTFELIKHGKVPVFNVVIRKKKTVENHMQVKKKTSTMKKETKTTIDDNHRFFISTIDPGVIRKSGLHLPVKFSIQNGLKYGQVVLRDDKGRSWKARLNKQGRRTFCVGCGGLRDFCNANGLKEVDTYKFEIVENEKDKPPVIHISLNIDSTVSRKEDNPYFIGEVKGSYIEKSMLYLPGKFTKKSGLFDKEEMILKNVNDERSWTVELKGSMNQYRYIGRGWKDFCVANGLEDGDLFKLELVSNGEKPVANFYFLKICKR